jgi:hypothetical protein
MANAQLKHEADVSREREKPSTQFSLKIKRNVWVFYDLGKGLVLGEEAVAIRSGRPPLRGKIEATSPRSVVMIAGRKRRTLSRSLWRIGPVVATQYMRDI